MSTAREHVAAVLLAAGDADDVLWAIETWLAGRAEQLRAEGLCADAAWFSRIACELRA
jgi:hypothetical protein